MDGIPAPKALEFRMGFPVPLVDIAAPGTGLTGIGRDNLGRLDAKFLFDCRELRSQYAATAVLQDAVQWFR